MAVSFERFSITRFVVVLKVRRVRGERRMGVAPACVTSKAKVARLVR